MKTIQELGARICELDATAAPNDEVNIAQANRIAKLFVRSMNNRGWGVTRFCFANDLSVAGECTPVQALRITKALCKEFNWYGVPFTEHRRIIKNLVK